MKKKLIVLGRGTAGALAMAHFVRWMPECELEWHFDPLIATQTVGEGSSLLFPRNLFHTLDFTHEDLNKVNGSFKTGIAKEGWGKKGKAFIHNFPPPNVAYHFNAVMLQDYILSILKNKVKVVENNISSNELDANFIMDCSGKPKTLEKFDISSYIPVNSVHVTQCDWDYPRFQYTLTVARPYGWVFAIPLQDRCSVGYLYNKDINTLEDVKKDVNYIFDKYDLIPSDKTNSFSFGNYTRKKNYNGNIVYNGNASFFLEPIEATSIDVMDLIQRGCYDLWNGVIDEDVANNSYKEFLTQIEVIIMMHYFAGSPFKTAFWEFAKERGVRCMNKAKDDNTFRFLCESAKKVKSFGNNDYQSEINDVPYGTWLINNFYQNIKGLDIENELNNL